MYKIFKEITIDDRMVDIAERHAYDRTKEIVQQFKGQYGGPSTHEESNYYGAIGELSVKKYLNLPVDLDSNYTDHKIDEGDIFYNNLIYDVKTTARMERYFFNSLFVNRSYMSVCKVRISIWFFI